MKVKVGDKVYDSLKQPIMVILEAQDRKNIANMPPRYCQYNHDNFTTDEIREWMEQV